MRSGLFLFGYCGAMSPPKPPRSRRRDAGRPRGTAVVRRVLRAAAEELAAHGVAGLSIERVAAGAEVHKTSIYRRFGTRERLVAATVADLADGISLQTVNTGSLRGDLRALAGQIADLAGGPLGKAVLQAAASDDVAPEIAAIAQGRIASAAALPAGDLVQRAVEAGQWRADAPPQLVFGMLIGAAIHRAFFEHQSLDDAYLDQLVDFLVRGVRPGP